jgi:hypothetical protein
MEGPTIVQTLLDAGLLTLDPSAPVGAAEQEAVAAAKARQAGRLAQAVAKGRKTPV